ncbi:hypothetical protein [Vibrio mediterranei]|nr:hypothetical protein [Vibrio mediterranei]
MQLASKIVQSYVNWVDNHIVEIAYVGSIFAVILTLFLNFL